MEKINTNIQTCPFSEATDTLKADIIDLITDVWSGENTSDPEYVIHHDLWNAYSFYIYDGDTLVTYGAVYFRKIQVGKHEFQAAGLSFVIVRHKYRGLGYGKLMVDHISTWLRKHRNKIDFGMFSCFPEYADLFVKYGKWVEAPNILVTGNIYEPLLNNKAMNVSVMMQFFSGKAIRLQDMIMNSSIMLHLPEGMFM